ncbi:hypothetical protein COHA_000068 [Chlorella ohadii]|uniref:F-box domain-containing protein n=1 Tax=Chlorella ohadii TaxID=2649997 RepID=A0AAD5E0S5_9CHLO|nr:hypothetical protein COHA_000068 [Chlorella ohadii]
MDNAPEAPQQGLLHLPDALLRRIALLLNPLDRSRLCLASRRLVALGDECEELWADLEVAMHMFDVHRLTEALRRQRHSVRSVRLAPLMRGRPAVQAAEMEMLVDDFFKALEGGALQQATLVSLVPPGRRPAELGKGACPYLHHLNPGSLPPSLARLCIEDDGEGDAWRYALPASIRQLGSSLWHLHLATVSLKPLPLRHLGALSGLTSLQLGSLGRDTEAVWPFGEEWGDSDSASGSDGSGDEEGGGASARAEEAAWASGAAGPLLPYLRQLVVLGLRSLPPAFSRLTTLTHVQLGLQPSSRTAAAVPEFVWRLPHLKVASLQGLAPGPGFAQHAAALPLEALTLDLATAADVAPATLAALPALRRLEERLRLPAGRRPRRFWAWCSRRRGWHS